MDYSRMASDSYYDITVCSDDALFLIVGLPILGLFFLAVCFMHYHAMNVIKNMKLELEHLSGTIAELRSDVLISTEINAPDADCHTNPHEPFRSEFAQHQRRVDLFHQQQNQASLGPMPHTYAAQPELYRYPTPYHSHPGAPDLQVHSQQQQQQTNSGHTTAP